MPRASTAVAAPKSTAIASMSAELQAELAELKSKMSTPTGDRILVTQDKLFKLTNGESAERIQCIIVDFVSANFYYEGAYVKGDSQPATCFAINSQPTEMAPSPNSPEAQAESCSSCWANQFGSAGKAKACKNHKLLAVLQPEATDESPLMILKVPPTSVKGFESYVGSVARAFRRPPKGVITEISFDEYESYPKLKFTAVSPVEEEVMLLAHSRKEEALERLMVEPDVSKSSTAVVAPKRPAPKRPQPRKAA